ncbi:MAG: SH3 domain-containing protein, partial [Cyclobacteriaceae bacterium]|nr:SH3 domain-containing protein [Cyclobacteriaceae bacterium]
YLSLYFKTTNDFSVLEKQQSLADKHNLAGYQLSDSARLLWIVNSYGRYFSFLVLMLALVLFLVQVGLYKKRKSLVFPVMLIFLVGSSLVLNYLTKPTEQGIIIASKTFAMDGPSGAANVVTQVTPGSKVEVLDRNDIWVKVSLNDKFFYVRYDALQIITF